MDTMKAILWGWRKIGNNYPEYKNFKQFSIFPDVIDEKVRDLNNTPDGIMYEKIIITIEKAQLTLF